MTRHRTYNACMDRCKKIIKIKGITPSSSNDVWRIEGLSALSFDRHEDLSQAKVSVAISRVKGSLGEILQSQAINTVRSDQKFRKVPISLINAIRFGDLWHKDTLLIKAGTGSTTSLDVQPSSSYCVFRPIMNTHSARR